MQGLEKIVIVGGGTAGWMAAIGLASRLPSANITVLDPSGIAAIGVGESVTGSVQTFVTDPVNQLDISEFYQRTNATLKMGIWYRNWQGEGTDYLTPIDSPGQYFDHHYVEAEEDFFAFAAADGAKLGDLQIFSQLMRRNLTDFIREEDDAISGRLSTASCHFDALKFADWLKEKATQRPNITHIDDEMEGFEQDPDTGHITHIKTRNGQEVEGDFFLDCSGFRRLLLQEAYQPGWLDSRPFIKLDTAIPTPVPHPDSEPIPTYTESTAMPNGWMWRVPTSERLGRGYVYSSQYVSDEDAVAEMRAAGLDPGDEPRFLRFSPGRLKKQWCGNVCAIGLAGGFAEPLEATTIHLMVVQVQLLSDLLLPFYSKESSRPLADKFNRLMDIAYEDYIDFISFHYHTGRTDSEFWRDYQRPESITMRNQERLELWRHSFPSREDFAPTTTQRASLATSIVVWMPMLCGMGLLSKKTARARLSVCSRPEWCRANAGKYIQIRNHLVDRALTQREVLEHFRNLE